MSDQRDPVERAIDDLDDAPFTEAEEAALVAVLRLIAENRRLNHHAARPALRIVTNTQEAVQ